MVLVLDGNSLIDAQVKRNLCYSTCLRHLISSRAVTNRIFLSEKKPILFNACATSYELPSNINKYHVIQMTEKAL